jgi:hypothetical protein
MARTALKLVTKRPSSAEREKLAEAIANHAAATRGIHIARAALERAQSFRTEAETRLAKAKAGVEKAKDRGGRQSVYKGRQRLTPGRWCEMRLARQAETDAEDALEVAHKAIAECEQKLAKCEKDLRWAEPQLTNAVDRVLAAESGARVLKEAQKLQQALLAKRLQLREMAMSGQMQGDLLVDANRLLFDCLLPSGNGTLFLSQWAQHPALVAWAQMRAALAKDADAPTSGGS